MNKFSDDDSQLTNFLRQYRSIPPHDRSASSLSNSLELEDRIMAEIDRLPIDLQPQASSRWWRSLFIVMGMIATGILGMTIHSIVTPPTPSMAELEQIDRYLVANWQDLDAAPQKIDTPDNLDEDILQDEDTEDV